MGETRAALRRLMIAWLDLRLARAEHRLARAQMEVLKATIRLQQAHQPQHPRRS